MFKDIKTGVTIYADLGTTVSRATLRSYDLTHAFLSVIRDTPEYAQFVLANTPPAHAMEYEYSDWWDSDDSLWFGEELFDILNMYAPDGYYFGTTEGDGSDFGYWKYDYDEEE